MKYLKVFTDFAEDIAELNDAEAGRLFRAMLLYAETGKESDLKGNERFIWRAAKKNIDNQIEAYGKMCDAARKGASARWDAHPMPTYAHPMPNDAEVCRTQQDKDKDKEKEKGKKDIGAATPPHQRPRFVPPSVEDVQAYCLERNNGIDPQRFVDFYEANGWKQGAGKPIKDWKACVRTWEGRENNGRGSEWHPKSDAKPKLTGGLEL